MITKITETATEIPKISGIWISDERRLEDSCSELNRIEPSKIDVLIITSTYLGVYPHNNIIRILLY